MFPGRPGLDVRTSAWVAVRCGIGAAAHDGMQAEPHEAMASALSSYVRSKAKV